MLLIQTAKDMQTRLWYMEQTIQNGWSRDMLGLMIRGKAHEG
jgi:predicted nuclease of restriction endonuclease-like (RecB) superfamily